MRSTFTIGCNEIKMITIKKGCSNEFRKFLIKLLKLLLFLGFWNIFHNEGCSFLKNNLAANLVAKYCLLFSFWFCERHVLLLVKIEDIINITVAKNFRRVGNTSLFCFHSLRASLHHCLAPGVVFLVVNITRYGNKIPISFMTLLF